MKERQLQARTEGENPAVEGGEQDLQPPLVPTSTNPTNPRILSENPRTHLKTTQANQPGKPEPIQRMEKPVRISKQLNPVVEALIITLEPNSKQIPFFQPNIITQEAVNTVTTKVY